MEALSLGPLACEVGVESLDDGGTDELGLVGLVRYEIQTHAANIEDSRPKRSPCGGVLPLGSTVARMARQGSTELGGGVMRSGAIILAITIALAGCATQPPMRWVRPDGNTFTPEQFEVDRTICRGEMQKANLASNAEAGLGRGRAVADVYPGCMAQRGYMLTAAQ